MKLSEHKQDLIGLVGAVTSAAGAFSTARQAKYERDGLLLANALAKTVAAVTGVLIVVRALRKERKLG